MEKLTTCLSLTIAISCALAKKGLSCSTARYCHRSV